jgi:uncharacterized membrane protein
LNKNLVAYLATAAVMLALDMLWLGLIAKSMYQSDIGHLMAESPKLLAAGFFYALYALGLMVFAVVPNAEVAAWSRTVAMGALFGFFAYATYDLTNLATLKDWPLRLTLVDIAWGTVVSAVAAGAGQLALRWAVQR